MLTFAAAVFFLIITPGPGVLSTAGVGSGFGVRAGALYVTGLWLGNNLVGLAVVSGLTATMLAVPSIRMLLLWASVAYLFYLAVRIALAGSRIAFIERREPPGIGGGLVLQAINPKCYAVNTTFFSGFAFFPDSVLLEIVIKFAIINVIWIPIHFLWLAAGISIRKLQLPSRIQLTVNIFMALSMLLVVALAALAPS
jgi:threonine/homoserine/homoserine lactone efflux protein